MDQIKADDLKKFLEAVERGKKLHPGPFTISEWRRALNSEIFEAKNENCWGCNECSPHPGDLINLRRYQSEIQDIAVVAYRMAVYLGGLITERETKAAMEHDPR